MDEMVDGVVGGAVRAAFVIACVCFFWMIGPSQASAETADGNDDGWAFFRAWSVFRADIDATIPGEHGQVLLIERLEPGPSWLVRDGLRISRDSRVITRLARRAASEGDAASIPALRAALNGAPAPVSRAALERALACLGDAAIRDELAERLRRGSTRERWDAAQALSAAGAKAIPVLSAALTDPDTQTRLAAASALTSEGDGRALKLLGGLLASPNRSQQLEAAHALAAAGDPRAIPLLRQRFELRGGDRVRLARSLGMVGGAPERELLIQKVRALSRRRAVALRREIQGAIGRITLRLELQEIEPRFQGDDGGDAAEARELWLEEIGRAVIEGATERHRLAEAIVENLERPLYKQTPMAHQRRRRLASPLVSLLRDGEPPPLPRFELPNGSDEQLLERLETRGGDARARLARFGAALALLERLGERLGHPSLAEPPEVRAVGLNADHAVDGSYLSSWIAGEMAGSLRLDLSTPRRLRRLRVINGCVDSPRSYREHARVRRARLRLDGERVIEGRLSDDEPYFQTIELPDVEVSRISLEVTEVYPGDRAEAPACIAELRLE